MNEVKTEKKRAGAGGDGEKIAASPTDQVKGQAMKVKYMLGETQRRESLQV